MNKSTLECLACIILLDLVNLNFVGIHVLSLPTHCWVNLLYSDVYGYSSAVQMLSLSFTVGLAKHTVAFLFLL